MGDTAVAVPRGEKSVQCSIKCGGNPLFRQEAFSTKFDQTLNIYRNCRFLPAVGCLKMRSERVCSQLCARMKWGTMLMSIGRVVEGLRRRRHCTSNDIMEPSRDDANVEHSGGGGGGGVWMASYR